MNIGIPGLLLFFGFLGDPHVYLGGGAAIMLMPAPVPGQGALVVLGSLQSFSEGE